MSSSRQRPWHHNARQYTLIEYASLKQACPDGIYISLKPGSSLQWFGVLFVRKGPYAKAILRFQVTFPSEYPYLPPSVTFVTDIFHPLITPLTTYTYTTGYLSSDTVSATDEERLPPGGYSLRHGFPHWFKRTHQSPTSSPVSSQNVSLSHDMSARARKDSNEDQPQEYSSCSSSSVVAVPQNLPGFKQSAHLLALDGQSRPITMLDVLQYIKQSFDEEHFLNMLPLEAAGNPGAWKAWRAYRSSINERANTASSKPDWGQGEEWNWDGVWEERVRKGVETSISESVLYGGTGAGHDFVRFTDEDEETLQEIKTSMYGSMHCA